MTPPRRRRPDEPSLIFDHQLVDGQDFSGLPVGFFCAIGSTFRGCSFRGLAPANFDLGSSAETSLYEDCTFDGSRMFIPPGGSNATLVRCSFTDTVIDQWTTSDVELIDCTFDRSFIKMAIFSGTVTSQFPLASGRTRNRFEGNDFRTADLRDVTFRGGIDLTKNLLPTGPQYVFLPDAADALARAREASRTWPDEDGRRAHGILGIYGEDVDAGQRQLLLREGTMKGGSAPAWARLLEFWRQG